MATKNDGAGVQNPDVTLDALKVIWALSICGLVASAVYGASFSLRGTILALLASVLGYAAGGMIGFLFGFPRYTENAGIASVDDLRKALAKDGDAAGLSKRIRLNANTNLERIVDWLMTIIVGSALVNVRQITEWGRDFFQHLANSIHESVPCLTPPCAPTSENGIPGALLVLPFTVAGFLHLYLWARRFLPKEWTAADEDFDSVVQRVESIETSVTRLENQVWPVGPAMLSRIAEMFRQAGVGAATVDEILNRYREADAWESEPFEGFGKPVSAAFALSADVRKNEDEKRFEVKVFIKRTDGGPQEYKVSILLHNTYDEPVVMKSAPEAAEGFSFLCDEDFVVGALVIERSSSAAEATVTKLALDLQTLPAFRK